MARIAVVTDTSADLSADMLAGYKIHIVPQIVVLDEERLLELEDITREEVYRRLRAGEPLHLGHPTPDDFRVAFRKMAPEVEGIVVVSLSTTFNPTLVSAEVACVTYKKVPGITVNSRLVSAGLGFVVLAAAEAANQGGTLEAVADAARAAIPRVHLGFVAGDMRFLQRAGMVSPAAARVRGALGQVPWLGMRDGHLVVQGFGRSWQGALERMLTTFQEKVGERPVDAVVVHGDAPERAAQVQERVCARFRCERVHTTMLTPLVGQQAGPGTVGVALRVLE